MMNFIYLHCFILFVLLHGVISDHRNVLDSRVCFDDKFSFGVATASYQIEGAWNVSGKGESIWDRYTHAHPDMVVDRSNADVADGSYYKVKEDVALMVKLGIGFYRFSIAWSRILPIGLSNYVNEDGIRYYKELLAELRRNHITPVATMYHFDLPQNLQELGGWTNPIMADYFVDYARVLLDTFGDEIKIWLTFNEPYTFCEDGYGGIEAPGANSSGFEDYLCGHNVLRAHGMVYRMFDKEYRKKIGGHMGITLDFSWLEPATTSVEDQQAAETARQFYFGWFAHPIFSKYGDYPPVMRSMIDANSKRQGFYHSRLPYFTSKEVEMIRGAYDFLGLNHYTTYLVKHGSRRISLQPSFIDDMNVIKFQRDEWPKTNSSWLKVVPWGFRKALNWVRVNYRNPKTLITENGVAFERGLHDTKRVNYIDSYLRSLHAAIHQDGCYVIGYAYWSLLDNFEWTRGFSERFGLHEVDYQSPNLTRTPRLSAKYFTSVAKTGCLPNSYADYTYDI
ncbi:myrosinase 1-like [Spodoptera frugiperda]|uniref:beta-glucosidase n=1 Tax=Spodoptera frugiperda TaxID=7108 RepID=A0A9R0DBS8_SPOFR|nr:myrosinase 1-like [Spodoptera frugiperda]